MDTHTHTHTHIPTHGHTHTYLHMDTHIPTHRHTHIPTHGHTHTHLHTHTHTFTADLSQASVCEETRLISGGLHTVPATLTTKHNGATVETIKTKPPLICLRTRRHHFLSPVWFPPVVHLRGVRKVEAWRVASKPNRASCNKQTNSRRRSSIVLHLLSRQGRK